MFCVLAALLAARGLAAQADSTRGDSALARPAGLVSRTTVRGTTLRSLLADDPEHVLGLVPGVVLRRAESGLAGASVLSIRGGVPGAASVYIDGAPVRLLASGIAGVALGPTSVAGTSVTAGPPDLGLPDLRDGIIEYEAEGGGSKLAGSLRAGTDEAFPGVGFNRFDGSVGGPLPGSANATFFVGGTLMGQRSHYLGLGADAVPSYVPGGIDTIVPRTGGGQAQTIPLPRFVDHRAYDWGTDFRAHAKVQYRSPSGASVSVTGVANELQQRFFPGMFALTPSLYTGSRFAARLLVANWRQPLGSLRGWPLSLRVNASLGSNQAAAGPLEAFSQLASRDPALGITLETLRFTGADVIALSQIEQIVRNVRTNSGLRVPFLNRNELRNAQDSRANPYGMESFWVEAGVDAVLSMTSERRAEARWGFEWQASNGHELTLGGDVGKTTVSSYTSGLLRQDFFDVYHSEPSRFGLFVSDRIGSGDLHGEVAVRYDHFGRVGLFPNTPGRIYSNPAFNQTQAITDDTAYANSLARVMTPGKSRSAVSVRAAVEQRINSTTNVRAAVGRWVEPPPLGLVLQGSNSDLDFTNSNDVFGRDVDPGFALLAEFGARSTLRPGLVADVAVYRQSRPRYVSSIESFPDPLNPGDIQNLPVIVKTEDAVHWGVDLGLDWDIASGLAARGAYGLRLTDHGAAGAPIDLPAFSTHSLTGALVARPTGALFAGFEGSLLLRFTSGTWYTSAFSDPIAGTGIVTPPFDVVWTRENQRLPWVKRLDARLQRSVTVGRSQWSFFAEARNVFSWQNFLALFTETGSVDNPNFRAQLLDVEFANIEREASDNARLLANGDINLVPNCDSWTITGAGNMGAVVNCVALRRAEARFGNGDGLYSLAERTTALDAFFNAFFGPHRFYGAGRSVRLGAEIRW